MLNLVTRKLRRFRSSINYISCLVLLTSIFLATSSPVEAQQVTIKVTNKPITRIFDEIKHQTGYRFFYDADQIGEVMPVTLDVADQPLAAVLDILFRNQPFSYVIEGKIITIVALADKKKGQHYSVPMIEGADEKIRGRVTNARGTPLEGVTIILKGASGRRNATVTAANGTFELAGQPGDILTLTAVGLVPQEIRFAGQDLLKITMDIKTVSLDAIQVNYDNIMRKKIPWTDTINLRNRAYMNLGQVLQGAIPGLSLQNSTTAQTGISTFSLPDGSTYSRERLRQLYELNYGSTVTPDYHDFDSYVDFFTRSGAIRANYATSTQNNGLIPQLRGVSGFTGNTSGMLIVIDGFVQEGFPSDYPIANIESIKVVKDPEELTKWGPQGLGGVILITSKKGASGRIAVNYTASFFYAPAPGFNRSRQQLAGTRDVLDYLRAAADSNFLFGDLSLPFIYNRSPAEQLLYALKSGTLPQTDFDRQWDSLGAISNDAQLRMLQQNSWRQNHIIRVSGATKGWNFSATGSYATDRTASLGNETRSGGLNLNNDFLLLKGKLRANLQVIINHSRSRAGQFFAGQQINPYQLLTKADGSYVYDYSGFNPVINRIIEKNGYLNEGVNVLEDARLNHDQNKGYRASSRLILDWDLARGLRFSSSLQSEYSYFTRETYVDVNSSRARQQINEFARPVLDVNGLTTGLIYHVPKGSILDRYYSKMQNLNLRSALIFDRSLGKHQLSATAGGGGFSNGTSSPEWSTLYGYDKKTGQGKPVSLPIDPTFQINNFYSLPEIGGVSNALPYLLLNPNFASKVVSRGLNWNASIHYDYDKKYAVEGQYVSNIIPTYGAATNYSYMTNYRLEASHRLDKSLFRPGALISELSVAAGVEGFQIPGLPEQIIGARTLQPGFGDYGIWVSSYNLVQQSGQRSRNLYQKIIVGLSQNRLIFDVSYNSLLNNGIISEKSNEVDRLHYFGANAKLRLRDNLLQLVAGVGKSPEGRSQTNVRAAYDIGREKWFSSAWVSSLTADVTLRNISSFQGIQLMAGTNTPLAGGGFSPAINTNFGLLPPAVKSLEIHGALGMADNRYKIDLRYYRRVTDGLNNTIPVPTDPSSGLPSQVSYSSMLNKGVELYLVVKVIEKPASSYTVTLNGAYNRNIALSVPTVNYSQNSSYLTAYRSGYSTENIWSYQWAGLNNQGAPQIYDTKGAKTAAPDSTTLATAVVYSGVVRAPYTGGFIQEATYQNFFARVSVVFNLGYVMRQYIPSSSGIGDNSALIARRWRKPGDEQLTDIAAMANVNSGSVRTFIIQNASNSILSADHIRLQEVQIGWQAPVNLLKHSFVRQLSISLQGQNLALWTRNKLKVDPQTVSSNGFIGLPMQRQFSLTLNMTL